MSSFFVMLIIGAVFVLILLIVVGVIIAKVVGGISKTTKSVTGTVNGAIHTLQAVSQATTGTSNIAEGIKRASFEYSNTPKTVYDQSSIHLPKIAKDFPEYNRDEMAERAKNVLTSYLFSLDESDPSHLIEGNEDLRNKLTMQVKLNQDKGYVDHYERMKVHRCVLHSYNKTDARCTITYEASIQYIHYLTEGDVIKTGRKDQMTQAVYEITQVYIQDRDQAATFSDMALSSVCPHCGAPIKGLGDKVCAYCGSDVEIMNIYAWSFSDVKELRV